MPNSLFYSLFAVILVGCGPNILDYDGTTDRHTGPEAQSRIEQGHWTAGKKLPDSARNFYLFDGGTFNGSITYVAFDCGGADDCFAAIEALSGPEKAELKAWTPSQYAVVMNGPGFYSKKLDADPWNVRDITHGVMYEKVTGNHHHMTYFAIDLDRNRVYYHYESGGFPSDAYQSKQPQ